MTAVVNHAERLGKSVTPLIVPTNNALHAVLNAAKDLPAQEVILGASNKYTAEEQLDQIAFYWINLHGGEPQGLTVHIVSRTATSRSTWTAATASRKSASGRRRSVADLRAAGIGVRRVLLVHDGTPDSHDVFEWLLTMVAPEVHLDLVPVRAEEPASGMAIAIRAPDQQRAPNWAAPCNCWRRIRRAGPEIVRLGRRGELRRARAALARGRMDAVDAASTIGSTTCGSTRRAACSSPHTR